MLVVDDEPNILDVLSMALRFEGLEVETAASGTPVETTVSREAARCSRGARPRAGPADHRPGRGGAVHRPATGRDPILTTSLKSRFRRVEALQGTARS